MNKSGFSVCDGSADPPACLVERAALVPGVTPEELLEATIETGLVDEIARHPAELVDGAESELAPEDLRAAGIDRHATTAQTRSQADRILLAAVALASAAQRSDNPFDEPLARSLSTAAGDDAAISQLAVMLWDTIDTYQEWTPELTRPPGLGRIWSAIVARPPIDNDRLISLAEAASGSPTSSDQGLALLRILASREAAAADVKAAAASFLARRYRLPDEAQHLMDGGGNAAPNYNQHGLAVEIAEARLRTGYNSAAAQLIVSDRLRDLDRPASDSYLDPAPRDALEIGRANSELETLGNGYLHRARRRSGEAEDTAQWFALASDCFRRAGLSKAAMSAAREGLPFVASAVAARNLEAPPAVSTIPADSQRAVVQANGFGAEPVLALYKAGARHEAVQFGYLSGFARFQTDSQTGATIDFQAIIDDQSTFYTGIISRELIAMARADLGDALYQAIRRAGPSFAGLPTDDYERQLGLLAALAGRGVDMRDQFSAAAAALSQNHSAEDVTANAEGALLLAADWRRGERILARVRARGSSYRPRP
jgi:hypothetical protein